MEELKKIERNKDRKERKNGRIERRNEVRNKGTKKEKIGRLKEFRDEKCTKEREKSEKGRMGGGGKKESPQERMEELEEERRKVEWE